MANPEVYDRIKKLLGEDPDPESLSSPAAPVSINSSQDADRYKNYLASLEPMDETSDAAPAMAQPQPVPRPVRIPATVSPSATQDLVKQAISKKYGFGEGLDDDALRSAQETARFQKLAAGIGEAGATIGTAIAGVKPNPGVGEFYEGMRKDAGQGVEDIQARRKGIIENEKLGKEQALLDPNSPQSQNLKNTLQRLYPGQFKPEDLEHLAASDMDLVFKPLQLKEQIEARKQAAAAMANYRNQNLSVRDDQFGERMAQKAHQAAVGRIKGDKTLNDSVTKATNLENAVSNIENTGKITAQDMADMQSLAVANMGVGGGSSAHERADRYAKSMGINSANALQFLTGKPVDIGKDNPLFQRYKQIMQSETENFKQRAAKRIDALSAGNESIYQKNPDLKSDLNGLKTQMLGQLPEDKKTVVGGVPQVGFIEEHDGKKYKFKGGDPGQKAAWEEI